MSKMVQVIALLPITLALLVNSCVGERKITEGINSPEPRTSNFEYTLPTFGDKNTKSVPDPDPISLSVINKAGYFLLPVSVIFIFVNGFLVGLMCKNWEQIKDSVYYNSTLLCLILTSSDLALCFFLGLPVGIRLTFEKQLREIKAFVYYTEKIGFIFFEYLYILRVITVAVISAERCWHILLPFNYIRIATERRIKAVCAIIVALPLIRIAPVIYVILKDGAVVHCMYYSDGDGSVLKRGNYHTPLTCMLDMDSSKLPGFDKADIFIMATLIGVSWLTILISNSVIFKKVTKYFIFEHNVNINRKLMKTSVIVLLVSTTFALTHFSFAYAWCAHIMDENKNYTRQFICILSLFLSLFFHPWFYCLRMKNIRELVTGFKKSIKNFKSSTSPRSSATSTSMFRLINPRASVSHLLNRASGRVNRNLVGTKTVAELP